LPLSKDIDGISPQESFDGMTVYFAIHADKSTLKKVALPARPGTESEVDGLPRLNNSSLWTLSSSGIQFNLCFTLSRNSLNAWSIFFDSSGVTKSSQVINMVAGWELGIQPSRDIFGGNSLAWENSNDSHWHGQWRMGWCGWRIVISPATGSG
jgi:hypothetical protein